MINLYSKDEIERIAACSRIIGRILNTIGPSIAAGVKTSEINAQIESLIRAEGAKPAFLGYRGYPAASCISVNEEVVHGIPGKRRLKEGDIVSVDIGVFRDGYFGDAARSYGVGVIGKEKERLMAVTALALKKGLMRLAPETGFRIFQR